MARRSVTSPSTVPMRRPFSGFQLNVPSSLEERRMGGMLLSAFKVIPALPNPALASLVPPSMRTVSSPPPSPPSPPPPIRNSSQIATLEPAHSVLALAELLAFETLNALSSSLTDQEYDWHELRPLITMQWNVPAGLGG